MNNPTISFINSMYDKKIYDLKLQVRSEVSKYISSPKNESFYTQINDIYNKQVELINIERKGCISILCEHMYIQEFNNFMSIGAHMYQLKKSDKKNYEFIVDKAFATDSSLSMYKFKYA